jgi:hypothetical protein
MPAMKKKRKVKKVKTHESTEIARERVLRVAKKRGLITNAQARVVGRWDQAWYHLDAMRRAGLLKREGFNVWRPR